jgi:hypothetical protein
MSGVREGDNSVIWPETIGVHAAAFMPIGM